MILIKGFVLFSSSARINWKVFVLTLCSAVYVHPTFTRSNSQSCIYQFYFDNIMNCVDCIRHWWGQVKIDVWCNCVKCSEPDSLGIIINLLGKNTRKTTCYGLFTGVWNNHRIYFGVSVSLSVWKHASSASTCDVIGANSLEFFISDCVYNSAGCNFGKYQIIW